LLRIIEAVAEAKTVSVQPVSPAATVVLTPSVTPGVLPVGTDDDDSSDSLATQPFNDTANDTHDWDDVDNGLLPDGATYYVQYSLPRLGAPQDFYDIAEMKPAAIVNVLMQVVDYEGPIHLQEATRRVVTGWDMTKAGVKLLRHVQEAARRAQSQKRLVVRGDFLWPAAMVRPPARVPAPGDAPRRIEEICLEEIGEAAFICVRDAYGMERYELVVNTARLLGYKQTGANVRIRIEAAIEELLDSGRIKAQGDSISLGDSS